MFILKGAGKKIQKAAPHYFRQQILKLHYHIKSLRIRLLNFHHNQPILIYQMGKVGSSTVYNSLLRSGISNPIFQIHFLNKNSTNRVMEFHKKNNLPAPWHIFVSRALQKKIACSNTTQWKVITLVRDPIATEISGIFQNIHWLYPDVVKPDGSLDQNKITQLINKRFSSFKEENNYICTWFDEEIKSTFHIDLYKYPFDCQKGYTIIRKNNIELLTLKTEDLSRCFSEAMSEFLSHIADFQIVNRNVGDSKSYSANYTDIKANLKLGGDICHRIYSTKYATHFFSKDQIHELTERWSYPHASLQNGS